MARGLKMALVLGFAVAMAAGTPALAEGGHKKGHSTPAPSPSPAPAPSSPTPSSSSSSSSSESGIGIPSNATQLDAAKKALAQAQLDYDSFVTAKKTEFEASDAFQAAKKAVDEDQKALDAAEQPLKDQLKASDSRYASAVEGIDPAKKKLEEAVASKKPDEIAFRKYDVNHMQEIITNAETPLFSKDPAVQAAQAKLDADKQVLAEMQKKFVDYLNGNSDYTALQKALVNAQTRLAGLQNAAGPR